MGSLRLKKKDELNYKKGPTHKHCSDCNHYRSSMHTDETGNIVPDLQPRCKIIGLNAGRMYRINPNNICDSFDGSIKLKRLRGY